MLQIEELRSLLTELRKRDMNSPFIIYTGYNPTEVHDIVNTLRGKNVIVKFGRYIPHSESRYDEVLGVTLASENQFASEV